MATKNVDLSKLVTREGGRSRRKTEYDVSRINKMLDIIETNKARITYQVFHYMAVQEGLIAENRALPAVFQILKEVPKSWLVCDKRGRYSNMAKTKLHEAPEGIENWPFIPADKAEETYEKLSDAIGPREEPEENGEEGEDDTAETEDETAEAEEEAEEVEEQPTPKSATHRKPPAGRKKVAGANR